MGIAKQLNASGRSSRIEGAGFSSFVDVVPLNTGSLAPHDTSISAYAVEHDLADFGFGFAPGETTGRVRIRLVDDRVTRSADPTALGALNATPVPEPSTGLLLGMGVVGSVRIHLFDHLVTCSAADGLY